MIAVIDPLTMRRVGAALWPVRWPLALLLLLSGLILPLHAADSAAQPPYRWRSVAIGGGGFVTGVLFHPAERDLAYARTDVGGAYRWDGHAQHWVALTDWLGADDWNLMGIDAFAVDPADPRTLYLAAGTYMHAGAGNAAVLRSFDRGRHFERADLPFKLGGNQLGRANGERLAVDPHDGRVLLLGSRDAGLWRSADRGAHWTRVDSFPAEALAGATARNHVGREQAVGIAFVVFDAASGNAGSATPRIYVGVSTAQSSLYVSDDAGHTWSAVAGQPVGMRPSHMAGGSDGQWYLSYGDQPGPDLMAGGALWKYTPAQARWSEISPIAQPADGDGFGWGAVAVDPQHPQVLLASTFRRYTPRDEVFRSPDGGRSWTPLLASAQFDHSTAPWTAQATPHWIGALAIDPFDGNHALFVTGYGIWASRNLQAFSAQRPLQWWFQDRGLEETVPLDLLSPMQGAHLLSALGDIDGFRHDDLEHAQLQYAGPRLTNGESIDAAGQAAQWVVRSGTLRDRRNNEIRALYSRDGGAQWTAFASEPPAGRGAGHIAIAADASHVVWAPEQGSNWRTADLGTHWQRVQGLPDAAVAVADRVDAQRWYAVDTASGRLFESRDGAANFRDTGAQVGSPARDERARPQLRPDPWRAGVVYLASPTQGMMRWQDERLQSLSKPDQARSLGIGKALHEGAPPALYLAGRVDGVDGVFRSDDEGAQWCASMTTRTVLASRTASPAIRAFRGVCTSPPVGVASSTAIHDERYVAVCVIARSYLLRRRAPPHRCAPTGRADPGDHCMTASLIRRGCLLGLVLASPAALAQPSLPLLFADGAVLQRDQPMPVWGWASPNAAITVGFDGKRATARADARGRWKVSLPAHKAGGPYVLNVQGDGGQLQVRDVLVGDVWLASGQSNMEWPLAQASDGPQAVAAANDALLRHFKVPKSWALQPQARLTGGNWKAATPDNAGEFTAVGYFFAKELRASTGVPIGIVNSTWGGSAIEAWMDAASQGLTAEQSQGAIAAIKQRDATVLAATGKRIARWPKVGGDTPQWREATFDDSDWDSIPTTQQWELSGYDGMDGIAWYRTTVTLSAAEAKAGIELGVGQIDDSDSTYVNGTEVGQTVEQWNLPRVYQVPASALHAGVNHIAVRVEDLSGGGGMHGPDEQRFVQTKAGAKRALGGWKFRPAAVRVALADNKNQLPTLLYNQMIHPLQPFPVKGVIWYQGETNASDTGAVKYREQFAAMIQQWRAERGAKQLPFLWVQLANFKAGGDKGDMSPWALLRESQSKTLALPATGQAVIIDIGNPTDIHPTNKRDVGHRLALAARHVAYGETLVYSAPVFKQARFAEGQAVLSFDLQGSALQVRGGGEVQGFRIAGADRDFHPATARIEGDRVVVRSTAVSAPVAVRYGWSENPDDANLVNRERLPVSPFRTDTW